MRTPTPRTPPISRLTALASATLLLAACGGGGSGGGGGDATVSLSGIAAVGAAIVGGTVTARCADGQTYTTAAASPTSATGLWSITSVPAAAPPCVLRVSGGKTGSASGSDAPDLYSYAGAAGRTNITTLTNLVIAHASGQEPGAWFSGFGNGSSLPAADLQAALTALAARDYSDNPLTISFEADGTGHDALLDALPTGDAYTALVTAAAGRDLSGLPAATGEPAEPEEPTEPEEPAEPEEPGDDEAAAILGDNSGVTALINGERRTTFDIQSYIGAPLSVGTGYLTAGKQNDPFRANISGITGATSQIGTARACANNGIPSVSLHIDGVGYAGTPDQGGSCIVTTATLTDTRINVSFSGTLKREGSHATAPEYVHVTQGAFQYVVETFAPGNGQPQVTASFEGLTAGSLRNQGNGTGDKGWAGPWNTGNATVTSVADNPLGVTPAGGTALNGGDQAIRILSMGSFGPSHVRELEKKLDDDIYVSLLLRVEDATKTSNTFLVIDNLAVFIGIDNTYDTVAGGPRQNQFVVSLGDEADKRAYAGGALQSNTTHHVVGRLYKSAGSKLYDRFALWVDPAVSAQASPLATAQRPSGTGSLTFVGNIGLGSGNQFTPLLIDRLRFSDTWEGLFAD